MANQATEFLLSGTHAASGVLSALKSEFKLEADPQRTVSNIYHDTFDWRLYLAGTCMRKESEGKDRRLVWSNLDGSRPRETLRLSGQMPRFSGDFPPGLTREGLTPLLEMRALLPQVEVKSRVRMLRLLDEEEKTVLRLSLEEGECRQPGKAEYLSLVGRIRLLPVRGYIKPLQRVVRFLTKDLELEVVPDGMLEAALEALGRRPADYSSKLNFHFSPDMPAGMATREIHLHLLNVMTVNIPGTREDLDSEFLHDLRVAVRRTRSALTQIKGVFPPEDVERFKSGFAWLGQITGPTRDMDVYLLGYEEYRDSLQEQFRGDLDPLHDFLIAHQKSAHQELVKKLNSPHFHKLLKDWRSFLETPVNDATDTPNAERPLQEVANRRIYRIYKRVLEEGLAIQEGSPHEALHELRKNCKKLRYLIEFFRSAYADEDVIPLIKAIKILLDNLGNFQDLEVQAFKLREFAHQMVEEGEVPADTLLAMGMLVDGLLRRQQKVRTEFAARFAVFAGEENQATFRRLFAPHKKRKKGGRATQTDMVLAGQHPGMQAREIIQQA